MQFTTGMQAQKILMKNRKLFTSLTLLVAAVLVFMSLPEKPNHKSPTGSLSAIIPAPQSMEETEGGEYYSSSLITVEGVEELESSWNSIEEFLKNAGLDVVEAGDVGGNLAFRIDESIEGEESYGLEVSEHKITISARSSTGLYWGFTTLRLIMPDVAETGGCSNGFYLPQVRIEDFPEFPHRGLLLDCCRHFMEPEFVKKMIDNISLHKMNVLHWHLTEDQGWRIEIDAYPRLTEVGAWRTELDGSTHGGFYTKEQIREIVKYAEERNVEIIPEIEIPGHSQAALASYPWLGCVGDSLPVANKWGVFKDIYCAGNDSTLRFLETVLDEVCELFPSNRIHIGGDEAPKVRWDACDKCKKRIEEEGLADSHELQTWIIEHVGHYLESKGKTIIGWDEILEGGLPEGAAVQSWRGMAGAIEGVHLGTDVISSPTSHCYLDYPLNNIDLEKIYGFDPEPDEASHGPGRVLGGECNMWTERAPQETVESKVFPRAIGLAEVLWTGPETTGKEGAYYEFLERLDPHFNRLALLEVEYGLEAQPVAMKLALEENDEGRKLLAKFIPVGSFIKGKGQFVSTGGGESEPVSFDQAIEVDGPGEVVAEINYRGRVLEKKIKYPVDFHAGAYREISLDYTPSMYYTGGGNYALVDGKLGSDNFRDGAWQAVQGEDMEFTVDLGSETALDSVSINFFHYQDAWIFMPRTISILTSNDGEEFQVVNVIENSDVFVKNDYEGPINQSASLENVSARYVKVISENPGVCPDWHAAATMDTWLFVDEFVVRERR